LAENGNFVLSNARINLQIENIKTMFVSKIAAETEDLN
jgi:hypothetical protein